MAARRFSRVLLSAIDRSKIVGIRAGDDHRFIGIWAVVVDARVFVRSWTLKPGGWYRTLLESPDGAISIDNTVRRIRARRVRSERMRDTVQQAYARKYTTPSARQYVRGFATPRRREATLELEPR